MCLSLSSLGVGRACEAFSYDNNNIIIIMIMSRVSMSSLHLAVLFAYEPNKSHFAAKDIQVKY